ncbi:MAG: ABC transporter substrate-binding protein, partial [Actinomycetota bacterium]
MNKRALFGASLAALLTLAACGGDDGSSTDTTAAAESTDTTAAAGEGVSLAGSCPETVVFQTDWNPEAE